MISSSHHDDGLRREEFVTIFLLLSLKFYIIIGTIFIRTDKSRREMRRCARVYFFPAGYNPAVKSARVRS